MTPDPARLEALAAAPERRQWWIDAHQGLLPAEIGVAVYSAPEVQPEADRATMDFADDRAAYSQDQCDG